MLLGAGAVTVTDPARWPAEFSGGSTQDSSQEGPEKLELSPGTELGAVLGTSQEGGEHYEVRIAPVCWILPWACCCHSGLLTQSLPQPGLVVLRASPFHS